MSTSENKIRQYLQDFLIAIKQKSEEQGMSLAKSLKDLLHISSSVAYKKIKGDVGLSAHEFLLLSDHFKMNDIIASDFQVSFQFPALSKAPGTPIQFLREVLHLLEEMGEPEKDPFVQYATSEVPLFHYYQFAELTAFKLYVGTTTVWSNSTPNLEDYLPENLMKNQDLHALRLKIFHQYNEIPSREFYPVNMLDNTLNQISYLRSTGVISLPFAQTLHSQLELLVKWMIRSAEQGHKEGSNGVQGSQYDLYFNEIVYTNNLILAENRETAMVLATIDNPNYIMTRTPEVVQHIHQWFERMQNSSVRISREAERQRMVYFNTLTDRVRLAALRLA